MEIDLNSDASIEKAKDHVAAKYGRLDALINNAGATYDIDYLGGKVSLRDCFVHAYDTNVVSGIQSYYLVKLEKPSRFFGGGGAGLYMLDTLWI